MNSGLLAFLLAAAPAQQTGMHVPDQVAVPHDIELTAWEARSLADATERFARKTKTMECYRVLLRHDQGTLLVQFYPPNDTVVTNTSVVLHASQCNPGAVFTYGKHGFISATYIR